MQGKVELLFRPLFFYNKIWTR